MPIFAELRSFYIIGIILGQVIVAGEFLVEWLYLNNFSGHPQSLPRIYRHRVKTFSQSMVRLMDRSQSGHPTKIPAPGGLVPLDP